MSRWWWAGGLALVVVLAALGAGVAWREGERPCGASVTSYDAAASRSPLTGGAPAPLLQAMGEVGEVLGSRGYDYDQEVQLSAYAVGLGVRLRDDNTLTMLDDDLRPRWSVAVGTRSSTFDADDERYLVVTLPEDAAPEVVALDLATGERQWCSPLAGRSASDVSTQVLDDGSVVLLLDGSRLVRLGADGTLWEQDSVGSSDFVGRLDGDRLLVGGSPLEELLDGAQLASRTAGLRLQALTLDGEESWSHYEPAGTGVYVLGVADDRVLLTRATTGAAPELVALDAKGREVWSVTPARGTAFDATVRDGRVVVRAGGTWSAYDVARGARLWRFTVPETPQLLPYGAVLEAMPSLDADTMLIGATDALLTLDLRTGRRSSSPLPTDGVATTYWPYRLVAPPGLLAVATNTGAVVVRR